MTSRACRDCGNVVQPTARGCPQCAMNVEAENMIDRFIWRRFVPSVLLVAVVVVALVYLLR